MMGDILNEKNISETLETNEGRVKKRESTTLEYKQNFDWKEKSFKSKILKTIASFSNRSGGYIIFGVKDRPRELIGIDNQVFSEIDDADITSFVNTYLSPSVNFVRNEFTIHGRSIGVIYVYESTKKPIVFIKQFESIKESSIYYRYNSKNDVIKSGDLIGLLNESKERETKKFIDILTKMSKAGFENIGLFNMSSGLLESPNNKRFVLDENLLSKLKVLDKYSENIDGAPAVNIIGDIDRTGYVLTESKYIQELDILADYIKQNIVKSPKEYIKAIINQKSWYLPIYYFMLLSNINIDECKSMIKSIKISSQTKTKILERLENEKVTSYFNPPASLSSPTAIGVMRKKYFDNILEGADISISSEGDALRFLEATQSIGPSNFNKQYILKHLEIIFEKYYTNNLISSRLRKVVAYIDYIENGIDGELE